MPPPRIGRRTSLGNPRMPVGSAPSAPFYVQGSAGLMGPPVDAGGRQRDTPHPPAGPPVTLRNLPHLAARRCTTRFPLPGGEDSPDSLPWLPGRGSKEPRQTRHWQASVDISEGQWEYKPFRSAAGGGQRGNTGAQSMFSGFTPHRLPRERRPAPGGRRGRRVHRLPPRPGTSPPLGTDPGRGRPDHHRRPAHRRSKADNTTRGIPGLRVKSAFENRPSSVSSARARPHRPSRRMRVETSSGVHCRTALRAR
jgi:hypothetical protein